MTPHSRHMLLDVGGTFIKCADGRQIMIDSDGSRDDISASLKAAVGDAEQLAVAIPGPFDFSTGTFLMKHKFASVYGERFCDLVGLEAERFRFIHDVNCMLLGQLCRGGADLKDAPATALITIGTGLGFSMCVGGSILVNAYGSPLKAIYNLPCRDGILEDYVSKRGVVRGFDVLTAKEVASRAYASDAAALARFSDIGTLLGQAVAPILEQYGIVQLFFGGQISRSFSLMEKNLREALAGVACLKRVGPVSDISDATFEGLRALISGAL